jgi:hypothetical protein
MPENNALLTARDHHGFPWKLKHLLMVLVLLGVLPYLLSFPESVSWISRSLTERAHCIEHGIMDVIRGSLLVIDQETWLQIVHVV